MIFWLVLGKKKLGSLCLFQVFNMYIYLGKFVFVGLLVYYGGLRFEEKFCYS